MFKKALIPLLLSALLAVPFTGCAKNSPAKDPAATAAQVVPTLNPAESEAPAPTKTEPAPTESESAAPTETESEPESEPEIVLESGTYYRPYGEYMVDECFRNDTTEIRFASGSVIRKDLASGAETQLFPVAYGDDVNYHLIGVTENRLYFAWNEVEDWWGWEVYSVDYSGSQRQELGEFWDPSFDCGWLVLYGFRSDVSPTELRVIDRNDRIVIDEERGCVWDGEFVGESFEYLMIEDYPDNPWETERPEGWTTNLIRLDPDGTQTVLKSFLAETFYSPASIYEGVIIFMETNEFYDLYTLEPVPNPYN